MRYKERPAKEIAGEGGGNGMLNERRKGQQRRILARAEGMEC